MNPVRGKVINILTQSAESNDGFPNPADLKATIDVNEEAEQDQTELEAAFDNILSSRVPENEPVPEQNVFSLPEKKIEVKRQELPPVTKFQPKKRLNMNMLDEYNDDLDLGLNKESEKEDSDFSVSEIGQKNEDKYVLDKPDIPQINDLSLSDFDDDYD